MKDADLDSDDIVFIPKKDLMELWQSYVKYKEIVKSMAAEIG